MALSKRCFRLTPARLLGGAALGLLAWSQVKQLKRRRTIRKNLVYRPVAGDLTLPGGTTPADLSSGTLFFVGTATVLIRYAGLTILTDPNFLHRGDHVHLGYGLKAERLTNPAMELDDLPAVDLVLLSHLHEDHFDREVQARLNRDWPVITTRHAVTRLRKLGFKSPRGLAPWETMIVRKGDVTLTVTAMPGKHAPGLMNQLLPPVNGSLLEFRRGNSHVAFRMYISGDTLIDDDLREIPRQYPDIDLALLHLGGTRVLGVMVTMDGQQGVRALQLLAPREAIPIHYDDYDRFKSPLSDFRQAVEEAGLSGKVRYLARGDTYAFHSLHASESAGPP